MGGIADCPDIDDSINFYWVAYQDLSTERRGEGFSTVPYFTIKKYADLYKTDFDILKRVVYKVDEIYFDHLRNKSASSDSGKQVVKPSVRPKASVRRRA